MHENFDHFWGKSLLSTVTPKFDLLESFFFSFYTTVDLKLPFIFSLLSILFGLFDWIKVFPVGVYVAENSR